MCIENGQALRQTTIRQTSRTSQLSTVAQTDSLAEEVTDLGSPQSWYAWIQLPSNSFFPSTAPHADSSFRLHFPRLESQYFNQPVARIDKLGLTMGLLFLFN
uniref:Uncharacterized protein n=1 Tax=Physcomitrium patens TaxID=3218 RepID=A0A2K1KVB2_PHYPA|nr:hypothetical protein PHYPA_004726 [Physcomitrium patens]